MSPDIQKRAAEIADEVMRRWEARTGTQEFSMAREAAELALSGWTPPDPISPRVTAAREWLMTNTSIPSGHIAQGLHDNTTTARAFLAGFAAAVKVAEPLVEAAEAECHRINLPFLGSALTTYRQSIGDE